MKLNFGVDANAEISLIYNEITAFEQFIVIFSKTLQSKKALPFQRY